MIIRVYLDLPGCILGDAGAHGWTRMSVMDNDQQWFNHIVDCYPANAEGVPIGWRGFVHPLGRTSTFAKSLPSYIFTWTPTLFAKYEYNI